MTDDSEPARGADPDLVETDAAPSGPRPSGAEFAEVLVDRV